MVTRCENVVIDLLRDGRVVQAIRVDGYGAKREDDERNDDYYH